MRPAPHCRFGIFLASLLFAAGAASAQPSGGPYGPVDKTYEVPQAAHVYYVAPNGKAEAPGTDLAQPTTIEAAIAKVVTGDAIVMRGGFYRTGNLILNQGITIQPYAAEKPVLKGTDVATNWEPAGPGVWKTSWTKLFPAHPLGWWNRAKQEAQTPLHRFNNDMVFVDGKMLMSAGSVGELNAGTYYIDYDKHEVYIGTDPVGHVVEITAHDGALIRTSGEAHGKVSDKKGPVIRGITFTQYAWRAIEIQGKKQFGPDDEPTDEPVGPSDPSTFGKEVTGTVLEDVTITFCSRVAGYFRGDGLVIRNSLISDTGTEGIYVIGSADVLLEKNIIRRNNIEKLTGYYPSAVKIFNQSRRVTVRDNRVVEQPDSNGVWFDVGERDCVFVNNYVEGSLVGFFMEISRGMTAAGNVFVRNGRGMWVLNSADAHVYNNTFIDSPATISRNERVPAGDLFDWHSATGPGLDQREGHIFVNNLMVASEGFDRPLARIDQAPGLCSKLKQSELTAMDGNVYVRAGKSAVPLMAWAPVAAPVCGGTLRSLAYFRKLAPKYEAHAQQIDGTPQTVFKDTAAGDYELLKPLPAAAGMPAEVRKLLGWSEEQAQTVGAYPLER